MLESIVKQQAAFQRCALPQDDLHGFRCLDDPDHAGQNAEHAALCATGDKARGRRFRIEAAIAGAVFIGEHRGLSFEAKDGSVHIRLLQQHAGVIHQIARGKIVGAVDDDVVVREECPARSRWSARHRTCRFSDAD